MANLNVFIEETLRNGGASYNMWNGDLNPKDGYMVAVNCNEVIVPINYCETKEDKFSAIRMGIIDLIAKNPEAYALSKVYLGSWLHEGKIYLDFSHKLDTKEGALFAGKHSNQIAIWDNKNGVEIKVNQNETV